MGSDLRTCWKAIGTVNTSAEGECMSKHYLGPLASCRVPHPFAPFAKDSLLSVKRFFFFGKVQENLS
jgi:hypothetical protein